MSDDLALFDRRAVRRHRDRAAGVGGEHDFLHREVAARLDERLKDVARPFPARLNMGSGHAEPSPGPAGEIATDLSERLLRRRGSLPAVVADDECLPFAENAFDLITSCLALHWANDLPGTLVQIRRALRPDGLFLGALLGGDTLVELRRALLEAEAEVAGGAAARCAPVVDISQAGNLLQRAGFALPVADADTITADYPDMFGLLRDLRGMGETSALAKRRPLRRATLFAAAARYRELHGGPDGRLPATFQVIWLSGWGPHESQQRALPPGSATARLADALRR